MPIAYTHDFENGSIADWYSNELELGAAAASIIDGNATPAERIQGRYGAQMTLASGQKRCELVMADPLYLRNRPALFSEGEMWQFTWNFKLSPSWNNTTGLFHLIAQWFPYPSQNFSGSPPVSILAGSTKYGAATDLQLVQTAGQPTDTQSTSTFLATLASIRGSWTKLRVRILFSPVAAKSRVSVELNDVLISDVVPTLATLAGTGPFGTANQCYFKVGYYRDPAIASTDSIDIDYVDARQV